jgi:tetratricopeptide (TPR) repeat protein
MQLLGNDLSILNGRTCKGILLSKSVFLAIITFSTTVVSLWTAPSHAQPEAAAIIQPSEELSEEELRQIKTAERFLGVLEKNPRRGTALDRVYGHHVEFGSLDTLITQLKQRTVSTPDNGGAWMLLALFEAARGNDADAAVAFETAQRLRPDDGLASYYLAQAQVRIGQTQAAVASLELAIERKPQRTDLLEIFQYLGRLHQRAQRQEQAMAVWQRLEELFPDDPRVLEQIAATLAEEGQTQQALPRYQRLTTLVDDEYRRVVFRVTAAELTIKSGQRPEGLEQLEQVLADLNPSSWLHRDVRRRIDDVFLRSGDQDGLVQYYQNWLTSHSDDIDAMIRLARFLSSSARVPEALQWLERAIQLAPTREDLRKSMIDQLAAEQRFAEAEQQYEQLLKLSPDNPDYLRDWGKLVLRNREIPEDQRREQALQIWNRIVQANPKDATTTAQVADLCRQNQLLEQAEKLYRRAIELAADQPQYREYLGEFLHVQGRSEEAQAVWHEIAAGDRRSAENVVRLAEIYHSYGFPDKACEQIAEAVQMEPKEFTLQIRAAEYHLRAERYEQSLQYVLAAAELAANDDEQEQVVNQRIAVLQADQQIEAQVDELTERLTKETTDGSPEANSRAAADWYLLGRYQESLRHWSEARSAIDKSLELEPKSIRGLTAAARIAESAGDYGAAADQNRRLADVDRRSRSEHLMNVSRLESQMGRVDQALAAAQELIVAAPGNTENYEFYAQTCFRLGRTDDGLQALRKAVRINPNEPHLLMSLATALSDQLRTEEAIEVYWRAFEKADEVDDKTTLAQRLAPLYQQINQGDALIDRFERERQEEEKRREATVCLAQVWHTLGDFRAARKELESLLSEDTRDTNLLNQLSKLCLDDADMDAAIGYQKQLVSIAPGDETEFPLAGMLLRNGQVDEARDIYVKLIQNEEDPVRQLKSLDALLSQDNYDVAMRVMEPLLVQRRDDWELLYRQGVAWAKLDNRQEAQIRFERLLTLSLPLDTLGRAAEAKLKEAQSKAKSDNLRGRQTALPQRESPLAMRAHANQVQRATGLIQDNVYYGGAQTPLWMPSAYGTARMAALGWLLRFEEDHSSRSDQSDLTDLSDQAGQLTITQQYRQRALDESAGQTAIFDWLFVAALKNDFRELFEISRRMASTGAAEEKQFFLSSLRTRETQMNSMQVRRSNSSNSTPKRSALDADDLSLMQSCYDSLTDKDKHLDLAAVYGGNIIYSSNGQAYVLIGGSYQPLPGVFQGGGTAFLPVLVEEYRFAQQDEKAEQLIEAHLTSAQSAEQLAGALGLLLGENRHSQMLEFLQRWRDAALEQIAEAPITSGRRQASNPSSRTRMMGLQAVLDNALRLMGKLGAEEENAQVLKVLETVLPVAVAEGKHRRLVQAAQLKRASTQSSQPQEGLRVLWYYGEQAHQALVSFPSINVYLDQAVITLLRQAHEVLKKNEALDDLGEMLRRQLEVSPTEDQLFWQYYLASDHWWNEKQDEAMGLLSKIAAQVPDDWGLQTELASIYASQGDLDEALKIADSIAPRDQQVLQRREQLALALAERLGDTDRARTAAERLFGMRLNSQSQIALIEPLRRLGMTEMADAVLARAERSSSRQISSLASLMVLYQGQGKTDQANQLARTVLRRTNSPFSVSNRSSRSPFRYGRSSDDNHRTAALQLLQRTGALKETIEQLEASLQRNPESLRVVEQLIEFTGVANPRSEAVVKYMQKAIELRPEAPIFQLHLAQHYMQSGKHSDACDLYLSLMKTQPSWLLDDLHQIDQVFRQAKRKPELYQAMESVNLRSISQPYQVFNIVNNMMNEDKDLDTAIRLFERAMEAFPSYRSNALNFIHNDNVWNSDRFYELAKRLVFPSQLDIDNSQWSGLDQIRSYGSDGQAMVFVTQMIQGIKTKEKKADFEQSTQEHLEKHPGWKGGQAILALIELEVGKKDSAKQRLAGLADDDATIQSMPMATCWIIGQELEKYEDTQELALKLLDNAVRLSSQDHNQIQYSPVALLMKIYERKGLREKGRDLLLSQLTESGSDMYDQQYRMYRKIEDSRWASEKLRKLGFAVDAVRIYRGILDDKVALKTALEWYGNNDYLKQQIDSGWKSTIQALQSSDMEESIKLLLAVDGKRSATLDLMLSSPDSDEIGQIPMKSSLLEMLEGFVKDDPTTQKLVLQRLDQLSTEYPDDRNIALARAYWNIEYSQNDDPHWESRLQEQLTKLLEISSLEEIAEGRRANARQRREANSVIPIWLVARTAMLKEPVRNSPALSELTEQLRQKALAASARQLNPHDQTLILYEWVRALQELNSIEQAEKQLTELLSLVTQRKTNPDRPQATPPLSLSQFRAAMLVGKTAAEQGWMELSRKAVFEGLRGGMPVPDADPAGGNVHDPFLGPNSGDSADTSAIDAEVVSRVGPIVELWNAGSQPSLEDAEILKMLVFPPSRPSDIRLYMSATAPMDGKIDSLATSLVQLSAASGQLDQLNQEIDQRLEAEPNSVQPSILASAATLKTLIAIHSQQTDEAVKQLQLLTDLLTKGSGETQVQIACIAAFPAFERPELQAAALPILEAGLRSFQKVAEDQFGNPQESRSAGTLPNKVNRYRVQNGNIQGVKDYFETALLDQQRLYGRYGGDYGLYMQRQSLLSFAADAAALNLPDYSMELLGRGLDVELSENYGFGGVASTDYLPTIFHSLRSLSPEDRYQLWLRWSLPIEGRQNIRFASGISNIRPVPITFRSKPTADSSVDSLSDQTAAQSPAEAGAGSLVSNFIELIEAAVEAGQLDSLKDKVAGLAEEKTPKADLLLTLILIAQEDLEEAGPRIGKLLNQLPTNLNRNSDQGNRGVADEMLVVQACLRSPKAAMLVLPRLSEIRKVLRDNDQVIPASILNSQWLRTLDDELTNQLAASDYWKHWAAMRETCRLPSSMWFSQHGQIQFFGGIEPQTNMLPYGGPSDQSRLVLKYPLEGNFRVSVDCFSQAEGKSGIGYGGTHSGSSYGFTIASAGGSDFIFRRINSRKQDYRRLSIEVKDQTLSYLVNNRLVYSEPLSPTSPWLVLSAPSATVTAWKNIRFEGSPSIPRQVRLLSDSRMDGWNSTTFNDSQPRPRIMNEEPDDPNNNNYVESIQSQEPTQFDWQTQNGVLTGRGVQISDRERQQSWIYYHRPLLSGETLSYQFYYRPNQSVVYPTIGRLAFILEPDGVYSHYISSSRLDSALYGVEQDNRLKESQYWASSDPLPLKVEDWNQVELKLVDRTVHLILNGMLLMKRPLDAELSSHVGLFRFRHQEAKVREAILTGEWPESLGADILQELVDPEMVLSGSQQQALSSVAADETIAAQAAEIVNLSRGLPPEQAYQLLKDWVLPEHYRRVRLFFGVVQPGRTDSELKLLGQERSNIGIPVRQWLAIDCPAIELVRVASSLGRLDALEHSLQNRATDDPVWQRELKGMSALIAIGKNDFGLANREIEELTTLFSDAKWLPRVIQNRSAEFVVGWRAIGLPETRSAGGQLVLKLDSTERNLNRKSDDPVFSRLIGGLKGDLLLFNELAQPTGEARQLQQWQPVVLEKAEFLSRHDRPSTWLASRGRLQHIAGETWSQLYFQSPLRGKFEIHGRRTTKSRQEVHLAWGMLAAEPTAGLQATRVAKLMQTTQNIDERLEIPKFEEEDAAEFRIEVEDDLLTTFVNDVQIHQNRFDQPADPWVVLQAAHPHYFSTISNLRIVGNPEIPEQIDLLNMADHGGWRADFYGDRIGDEESMAWQFEKEQISGQKIKHSGNQAVESLLLYQRPMLEDGVIEFESWYQPGHFEVHPALGRYALLIRPSGIGLHQLSLGAYVPSGQESDDETPLESSANSVPLKENDWNRIRLELKGDQLTLTVNDSQAAVWAVEMPANQRQFGLFRYKDKSACRIRNIVYQGQWPKALPSIADQELASPE